MQIESHIARELLLLDVMYVLKCLDGKFCDRMLLQCTVMPDKYSPKECITRVLPQNNLASESTLGPPREFLSEE